MITELLRLFIGFLIVGALFTVVEKMFPAQKTKKVFRKGWRLDAFYFMFIPTVGKFISRGAFLIVLIPLYFLIVGGIPDKDMLMRGFGPISQQPLWLQAIEILIISDFIVYWVHRSIFHKSLKYWKIHAVHHSSEELDWLSSVRLHPLNELVTITVRGLPLILLGWSPVSVAVVAPITTLHAFLLHSNVNWTFGPFRYVISSPVFHRWHHTKMDQGGMKNFAGLFPIWDLMFGTFYMPEGKVPKNFGIDGEMPEDFKGQMLYPIK